MATRALDLDCASYDVNHPLGVDLPRTIAQLRAIADALEGERIWLTDVSSEYHVSSLVAPKVELRITYAYDRAQQRAQEREQEAKP